MRSFGSTEAISLLKESGSNRCENGRAGATRKTESLHRVVRRRRDVSLASDEGRFCEIELQAIVVVDADVDVDVDVDDCVIQVAGGEVCGVIRTRIQLIGAKPYSGKPNHLIQISLFFFFFFFFVFFFLLFLVHSGG